MIFTSCYDKKNIIKAFDAACELAKRANQVIPDSQLMEVIEKAQKIKQPPFSRGRRPAILYATQAGTAPATFLLSCLHQNLINEKYLRFMENSLRRRFNLSGIPIRFTLKGKD
jgi:GTP-binding protein